MNAWEVLCAGPGFDAALEPVLRAYQAPGRHYHNLHHVAQCLRELNPVRESCRDEWAMAAALLFHDCEYDPQRTDNEERSADRAARVLDEAGCPVDLAAVRRLILATKHDAPAVEGEARDGDERLVVDIDLSILGKPEGEFDAYERAIRLEYAHVPEEAFQDGRSRFLRGLLARPSIYATPHFRKRYEQPARRNLLRSLARLSEGKG